MMRRREMELESQITDLKGKLEEKKKEAEELRLELRSLRMKLQESNDQVAKLHAREGAVVSAMAEIETLRSQRVAQAETRAREITDEAQHVLDEAQAQAARTAEDARREAGTALAKADEEAQACLAAAKAQAENMLGQAEAFRDEHMQATREMNKRLTGLIQTYRDELSGMLALSERLCGENVQEQPDSQVEDMRKALYAAPVDTPESYENPAALMHNIYAMVGNTAPEAEAPGAEETTAPSAQEETPPQEEDGSPETETAQPEEKKEEKDEPGEERVWTVDEIVDSVLTEKREDSESYLEKLIEEIMQ